MVYQVYVRSFADSDGDGNGDLRGVRSRFAYLQGLGVDAVWLTPFYPSPQADGGYDVADYRDVDPTAGTLADFDALVGDAHELGLRVIIDIVPNHTSSEHPWFVEALAAAPGSCARARYLFREGRGPGGDEPPNDWRSQFGGPAWTRVEEADGSPGQWYLHLFDTAQPDLDWTNPYVHAEFESVLRFWLERDVDGFRIDVAHGLAKDPEMPDLGRASAPRGRTRDHPHWDRDEVHDIYRKWRQISDSYAGERVFVGEVFGRASRIARYLRPDELHTAFNFQLLEAGWDATAVRAAIEDTIAGLREVGAPPTWVLSNHDVIRHVTRFGAGEIGVRRARAAALLLFALPGSAYIYQGDELGLPEVTELPAEARRDPTFRRTAGAEVGRDGCRVPIPWSGRSPSYGFGPGPASWLPQPASWAEFSVERQEPDPESVLTLYRRALQLRREVPALGDGDLEWLDSPPDTLAFRREPNFVCVVNLGNEPIPLPGSLTDAHVLLASGPLSPGELAGDTAIWAGGSTNR